MEQFRSGTDAVCPFGFFSIPGTTPLDQKLAAERTAKNTLNEIVSSRKQLERKVEPGEADRRLKIGYLSSDLHDHATGYLMARMFELHDHDQFHLHAYTWDNKYDALLRGRLTKAFEVVRDIRGLADEQAAELIYRDGVDILVDLKGHTRGMRLPIVAHRPAPVIVHHVGYPGTLGASFIDYLVADHFVAPREHQEYFSEKIAYMPDCYQPTDDTRQIGVRPTRADCGLPAEGIVFCSLNQSYKLTPEVFGLWCQLLNEVPGSVLWLLPKSKNAAENLYAWAKDRGIAPERIIFAKALRQAEHLGRLQNADIALDTSPVNSHTTASDALWAGVPIVTKPGESFVSRVAGSIVCTLGMPELIARDNHDYLAIARELATNPELLQRTKARVWQLRTQSPLFDSARYTKNLEKLYRAMWRRKAMGLLPETLELD